MTPVEEPLTIPMREAMRPRSHAVSTWICLAALAAMLPWTSARAACEPQQCGPKPGMPNTLCADGKTMSGPGDCVPDASGVCGWEIKTCPSDGAAGSGTGVVCAADVMTCPDGSTVSRTGPDCAFAPCPSKTGSSGVDVPGVGDGKAVPPAGACPLLAKRCPDGSTVSAVGPHCRFPKCPKRRLCREDRCGPRPAMPSRLCSDGKTVAGPGACVHKAGGGCGWEIVSCPSAPAACPSDSKQCPGGTSVTRSGPDCSFPACPKPSLKHTRLAR